MKRYFLAFFFIGLVTAYTQDNPKRSRLRAEVFHYPYLRLTDRVVQVDTKAGKFSDNIGSDHNLAIVVFEEYRILEAAVKQYELDTNLPIGTVVSANDLAIYLPPPGRPYLGLSKSGFTDMLSNSCGPLVVGKPLHVSYATFKTLEHSVPSGFWKQYTPN